MGQGGRIRRCARPRMDAGRTFRGTGRKVGLRLCQSLRMCLRLDLGLDLGHGLRLGKGLRLCLDLREGLCVSLCLCLCMGMCMGLCQGMRARSAAATRKPAVRASGCGCGVGAASA